MAIFNFLENFFFISLAITFGLMLMLVYHFKERITVSEKRIDTINDVLISVVKELKNIQLTASFTKSLATANTSVSATPVPIKLNDKINEQIYYDISEVTPSNIPFVYAAAATPQPATKIVVSDGEEDDGSSVSESSSGSEIEDEENTETEEEGEEIDLGTVSDGSDDGEETVSSEEDGEEDTVTTPIPVVVLDALSEEDEIQINVEIVENTPHVETAHYSIDLSSPMELDIKEINEDVLEVETEARDSAPTTDPLDPVSSSELTEGTTEPGADPVEPEKPVVIEVETEVPVSIPDLDTREEKLPVFGSTNAKEQKKEVYRKMSIHQLRTIAISSGLSADNKMKKADLIRLLETLDDEEDQ